MLIWTNFHSCSSVEKDKTAKTCARMRKIVIMDVFIPEWNSATVTCEDLYRYFSKGEESKKDNRVRNKLKIDIWQIV